MSEQAKKTFSATEADLVGPLKEPFSDAQKYLLSIIVVAYFLMANLIGLGNLEKYKAHVFRPVVHSLAVFFGIDQLFAVFTGFRPMSYHSSAMITFQDGTQRLYEFPRFDKLSEPEKFQHTKLRMIFYDFMAFPRGVPFRPAIAKYIAKCNENSLNQPIFMTFLLNYRDIPAPTESILEERWRAGSLEHTNTQPYFVYSIPRMDSPARTVGR